MGASQVTLHRLGPNPDAPFPPLEWAAEEPNGLLAMGGDLSPQRLLNAYRQGIFPWYSDGQPILWWSPDPRTVLVPEQLHISRSLRKAIRNRGYQLSIDLAFGSVVGACAEPRDGVSGTWITEEMQHAYEELHRCGYAHSVEIWSGEDLVGGLYGVLLGGVFFGESMFSRKRDTSKIALVLLADHLFQLGGRLIDCQVYSEHLATLGAEEIPRELFVRRLRRHAREGLSAGTRFSMDRRSLWVPDSIS